jgi:hypothetical protein
MLSIQNSRPYFNVKGKSFCYISKTCSRATESSIERSPSSGADFLASASANVVDAIYRRIGGSNAAPYYFGSEGIDSSPSLSLPAGAEQLR